MHRIYEMKSSFHVSIMKIGVFLYLLYAVFYYIKDTIISQQKIGEGNAMHY